MKRFLDQWKDFLHESSSVDNAMKASKAHFKDSYLKGPTKGATEKLEDKFLIPGKIYSFLYTGKEKAGEGREFVNRFPVMLALGQVQTAGKIRECGIDLMMVPHKMRIFILDRIYKAFKKAIEDNEKELEKGKKGKKRLGINYEVASKVLDGTGWEYAYATFDRAKMARICVVTYKDWVKTVVLDTGGFVGKTPKDVHAEYIKRINT